MIPHSGRPSVYLAGTFALLIKFFRLTDFNSEWYFLWEFRLRRYIGGAPAVYCLQSDIYSCLGRLRH